MFVLAKIPSCCFSRLWKHFKNYSSKVTNKPFCPVFSWFLKTEKKNIFFKYVQNIKKSAMLWMLQVLYHINISSLPSTYTFHLSQRLFLMFQMAPFRWQTFRIGVTRCLLSRHGIVCNKGTAAPSWMIVHTWRCSTK